MRKAGQLWLDPTADRGRGRRLLDKGREAVYHSHDIRGELPSSVKRKDGVCTVCMSLVGEVERRIRPTKLVAWLHDTAGGNAAGNGPSPSIPDSTAFW